ncbi:MAG: AAA family ATPase [Acidobacteriota bacterium]|nr:AAA family ATPase [Acidobacteriota bacterium]
MQNTTPSKTFDDFSLPFARETERSVLGSIILHGESIKNAIAIGLTAESFYLQSHKLIFAALKEVHVRGWSIDPRSLGDYLESQHQLDLVGGLAYIADLFDGMTPHAEKLSALVKQLEDVRYKRDAAKHAFKMFQQACNGAAPSDITRSLESFPRPSFADDYHLLRTWAELSVEELKTGETVIHELERGELGLLAAVTNVGKSTLLRNLMLSLAAGRNFPPIVNARRPRRVLLLDFETRTAKLQRDIKRMLSDFDKEERALVDQNLAIICDAEVNEDEPLCLSYQNHLNYVGMQARAFKPDLLIVDTAAAAFSIRNENDNAEVSSHIFKPLVKLARDLNTAILIAHHIGKAGSEEGRAAEKAYRARGASSFGAFPSLVLNLTQDSSDQDRVTLSLAKVKGERFDDQTMQLDRQARWFKLTGATASNPKTASEFLMELMSDGESRKRNEIEAVLKERGYVTATVKKALDNAISSGKLTQPKHGFYKLATPDKPLF